MRESFLETDLGARHPGAAIGRILIEEVSVTRKALEERYGRILAEHGASVRRIAATYEADAAEREDLVQEICLALWKALPTFREECSERTFLFRIAHNKGVTHRHRRPPSSVEIEKAGGLADPSAHPEGAASASQARALLASAIRELPILLRQTLTLSLEGLSHREISDVLGISETNVAVRLNRARAALKDRMSARREVS